GKLIWVAAEGDDLEIGALVAKIDTSVSAETTNGSSTPAPETKKEPEPKKNPEKESTSPQPEKEAHYAEGHPSPAAAKILKENDISIAEVNGSGKGGRITKEDALKTVEAKKSEPKPETSPSPSATFSRESNRKKMSRMRRTIAARLVSAKNQTAMLTTFN